MKERSDAAEKEDKTLDIVALIHERALFLLSIEGAYAQHCSTLHHPQSSPSPSSLLFSLRHGLDTDLESQSSSKFSVRSLSKSVSVDESRLGEEPFDTAPIKSVSVESGQTRRGRPELLRAMSVGYTASAADNGSKHSDLQTASIALTQVAYRSALLLPEV